jgi:hypothetical protein
VNRKYHSNDLGVGGRIISLIKIDLREVGCLLNGIMAVVLAIGSMVRGFKLGREQWILSAIKIRSTTSFGGQ